jgi:hypothetical protein
MNRIEIPAQYQVLYSDIRKLKLTKPGKSQRQYSITGLIINELFGYLFKGLIAR